MIYQFFLFEGNKTVFAIILNSIVFECRIVFTEAELNVIEVVDPQQADAPPIIWFRVTVFEVHNGDIEDGYMLALLLFVSDMITESLNIFLENAHEAF